MKIYAVPCQDRHFQAVPSFYTNFEVVRLEVRQRVTGAVIVAVGGDARLNETLDVLELPLFEVEVEVEVMA